jgi:hypothetical protein
MGVALNINRDTAATKARGAAMDRAGSALGFCLLARIRRSLSRGIILHALFQGADPLAQTFAELRQFLGTEHQQSNKEDHQQVHRLK